MIFYLKIRRQTRYKRKEKLVPYKTVIRSREMRLRGEDDDEHRVGMADDVLGRRVHRHVDPVLEGLVVERRAPGVVVDHHGAARVRGRGDGRDVLHLEDRKSTRLNSSH